MAEEQTTIINPAGDRGRILAQWEFKEYEQHDRSKWWYVTMFGIGAGLLIWAVADGNFLFALIILLFAFILFTHYRNEPLKLMFTLFERGIQVGDKFYLFRELQNFAIVYEPPEIKQLYLTMKSGVLRTELSVPLLDQDPVRLRELLIDYLEEDYAREEESGTDKARRVLKL